MIIESDEGIVSLQADGSALVVLARPRACECGRVAAFVVNRNGKTRCLDCDRATVQELTPPPTRSR